MVIAYKRPEAISTIYASPHAGAIYLRTCFNFQKGVRRECTYFVHGCVRTLTTLVIMPRPNIVWPFPSPTRGKKSSSQRGKFSSLDTKPRKPSNLLGQCQSEDGPFVIINGPLSMAYSVFLEKFSLYNRKHEPDALRDQEFGRIEEYGAVYMDYTGACLYPGFLVREHMQVLTKQVVGNTNSDSLSYVSSSAHSILVRS